MSNEYKGLYVVAVPIGNLDDITIRATKVLAGVDFVICEETKPAGRLLKHLGIKQEFALLNEHTERQETNPLFERLFIEGKSAALISDAGTPLFADPGAGLVQRCLQNGIPVHSIPGPSSLTAALSVCGLKLDRFLYQGFLPAKKEERRIAIQHLNYQRYPIVILDTPYRLNQLITDFDLILGEKCRLTVAYKLSYPDEKILWGTPAEVLVMTRDLPKGEFVVIVNAPKKRRR